MLWDVTPLCGDVYKEQALQNFFVEGFDLSICSKKGSSWAIKREASLEDLPLHAKLLLDLQGMARHEADRKTYQGQPPYRRQSEKNETRHVMAVQSSGTSSTSKKTQSSVSVSRNVVNSVTYASSEAATSPTRLSWTQESTAVCVM